MRSKIFLFLTLNFIPTLLFSAPLVSEFQLPNGLKLIVKPDHRSPVVLSSVWYKVGGSYEHNGTTGVSHALEHMMFRGTKKFPAGKLDQLISEVGGQQNAMTGNDFTMYYQLLPADKLELSFMLESDRMQNLNLFANDFSKEIQVVMEERRMRFDDNPQSLTWERFLAAAYINNPYHHQSIGWMTDLKNMTVSDLRNWYHTWYQPNNAILVVVGDVDPNFVYSLAQKYFGIIPAKSVPKLKPRTEIKPLGEINVNVNVPAKLPLLIMGYQTPTLTTTNDKWKLYALDVLTHVLGGGTSSRLQNNLVRQQQVATSIQVMYDPFDLHSNLLQIFIIPYNKNSIENLKNSVKSEITILQKTPITVDELNRIKAQIIAEKVYSRDSVQQQAMILGTPEAIGLSWQLGENYVDAISHVTPEQVQQVAIEFLITSRLTTGVLSPQ